MVGLGFRDVGRFTPVNETRLSTRTRQSSVPEDSAKGRRDGEMQECSDFSFERSTCEAGSHRKESEVPRRAHEPKE